jgi:uncharacterized protein (TIGR02996 family)
MRARAALEAALAENPDDIAAHMAYADVLSEQGDPRGEFVQVQLALEDERLSRQERRRLKEREKALLGAHERDWLGDLAGVLLDAEDADEHEDGPTYGYRRGWLDEIDFSALTIAAARRLRDAPAARLLTRLVVRRVSMLDEPGSYPPGPDVPAGVHDGAPLALRNAPFMNTLRFFQFGPHSPDDSFHVYRHEPCEYKFPYPAEGLHLLPLLSQLTRVEELRLLAHHVDTDLFRLPNWRHLRVLQIYHSDDQYRLADLAANPAFANLEELLLHPHASDSDEALIFLDDVRALVRSPHLTKLRRLQLRLSDLGDAGCAEIVSSGILKRLEALDLRHGVIADAGARTLADCPDLRRLKRLDMQRNRLTAEGVRLLRATGIDVRADHQHEPDADGEYNLDYLMEGDVE